MRRQACAVVALALGYLGQASAHRLDEYLQATMLAVEGNRVHGWMRLIPGVAVASVVLAAMGGNGDGVMEAREQRAYAERVLGDVSLLVDGEAVRPALVSFAFPPPAEMREGMGEIQIEFAAELRPGGLQRTMVFKNHHQPSLSVYLVNCLMPRDRSIQVVEQVRNENQSFYQVRYEQRGADADRARGFLGARFRMAAGSLGGFPGMFRLGMRHIAEGTDHLLFLLALLLPAPLVAMGSRWAGLASVRQSVGNILRVVTAFTIGHSITLALAAFGVVQAPSRPVEVVIAFSILVSAAHALRPLFPGREAGIAAGFGLLHGLAFAATLQNLGLHWWERAVSIVGFNLGIETMQTLVLIAVLPLLLLLSRTGFYTGARTCGALFALVAAVGWMAERL